MSATVASRGLIMIFELIEKRTTKMQNIVGTRRGHVGFKCCLMHVCGTTLGTTLVLFCLNVPRQSIEKKTTRVECDQT